MPDMMALRCYCLINLASVCALDLLSLAQNVNLVNELTYLGWGLVLIWLTRTVYFLVLMPIELVLNLYFVISILLRANLRWIDHQINVIFGLNCVLLFLNRFFYFSNLFLLLGLHLVTFLLLFWTLFLLGQFLTLSSFCRDILLFIIVKNFHFLEQTA